MSGEEGGRPRRTKAGNQIIYRECDSDDEDYETVALIRRMMQGERSQESKVSSSEHIPALNPLQLELRQICRLGDKEALKTFLANNPAINLDFREPECGSTLLTEAVTKTAQFSDIVALLLEAGADLTARDSLGNTPLHNSVLYFPATMRNVDLLLARGADVSIKNKEGSTPLHLSDDRDLKFVMKELKKKSKKTGGKPGRTKSKNYSPQLRKLVCDLKTGRGREKKIKVCYDQPRRMQSPGLLKRKREVVEEEEDKDDLRAPRTKRIRFNNLDSTGNPIDPQFSEDEEGGKGDNKTDDKDREPELKEKDVSGKTPSLALVTRIITELLDCI